MINSQDLNSIANNVELINDVWYSKGKSEVSYPEEGNSICFQIEEKSFWFSHRNSVISDTIRNFPPNGCLFDIGGGNGFVTKAILESGFKAFLVEPGISGINNAKKRNIKNLLCSTLEDAQFQKGTIPAIGIFDVLEHIENDLEFLKKISWYLEQEGMLYLTVPSYQFLWSDEDNLAGHFRRYTLNKLTKLLTDSGYKIIYRSYFFALLPIPILLFRTLRDKIFRTKKPINTTEHLTEHSQKTGILGNLFNFILKFEHQRISNSKTLPFGGSCIVVAQKLTK